VLPLWVNSGKSEADNAVAIRFTGEQRFRHDAGIAVGAEGLGASHQQRQQSGA